MNKSKKLEMAIKNMININATTLEEEGKLEKNINKFYTNNNKKVTIKRLGNEIIEHERDLRFIENGFLSLNKDDIQNKIEMKKLIIKELNRY